MESWACNRASTRVTRIRGRRQCVWERTSSARGGGSSAAPPRCRSAAPRTHLPPRTTHPSNPSNLGFGCKISPKYAYIPVQVHSAIKPAKTEPQPPKTPQYQVSSVIQVRGYLHLQGGHTHVARGRGGSRSGSWWPRGCGAPCAGAGTWS